MNPSALSAAPSPLPACGVCGAPLRAEQLNTAESVPCPSCGARGLARVFPALFRPAPAARPGGGRVGAPGAAGGAAGAAGACPLAAAAWAGVPWG